MIQLTRINKLPLVLNADLIEQIETTPDTVIQLINGQKLVVLESAEEVVRRVIEYRRKLISLPPETVVSAAKTGVGSSVAPGVASESE